jgi:hypothetical protein
MELPVDPGARSRQVPWRSAEAGSVVGLPTGTAATTFMNGRGGIVSLSEFEALKKALPEYTLILTLGYYLGMRRGGDSYLKRKPDSFL